MTFGSKLKQIRISMGLSQEEFAAKLNTTKQVISRYETEQRTPKITIAQNYAEILNVPLNDLIDNNIELNIKKSIPVSEDALSNDEMLLINLFRQIPFESRPLVLSMIKAALKNL